MFVTTRAVYDIPTGALLLLEGYRYRGPVARLKGASQAQVNLQNQQASFYQTMTQAYQTQFANQSAILAAISKTLQPIVTLGPSQYGFSPAEDTALRTQATEGTAAEYGAASRALGQAISSEPGLSKFSPVAAGGETYIPSGARDQLTEQLLSSEALTKSNQQLGITEAGYQQGLQNYQFATGALGGVASQYNPLGYAGSATGAGSSAFNSATEVQKMNNAASPWGVVGGILGGVAGSFLGPVGASIGSSIGSKIGGGGNSAGESTGTGETWENMGTALGV